MAEQRLIDANALDFNHINYDRRCFNEFDAGFIRGCEMIIMTVKNAPTVDAKPVVHAHWTGSDGMHCSHCERNYMDVADADSYESGDIPDFCPYCGAQMDDFASQ